MARPRVLHDEYFKRAKAEGYVARSAYKLLEINEKRNLIKVADKVIDLGCAPGSWLQVVQEVIGLRGRAMGVDLQEVNPTILRPTVRTMVGDAFTIDPELMLGWFKGHKADVLLSDMAPNTSGHGDDHLSARLCRRVLELAPHVLRGGGNLVMKVLEGADMPDLIVETRALFIDAGTTKPDSSRDVSREVFICARGLKDESQRTAAAKARRNSFVAPPRPAPQAGWGSPFPSTPGKEPRDDTARPG